MTQPHGHLDLDALADVLAGEGDDRHLRSCASCTDRLGELAAADASVTAVLTTLPPPPMPSGLPLRLTQALQQERRSELAAVRPLHRRRPPAWLPAAAASVVLVMAGAAGWSLLDPSGGSSDDTAASDAGGGSSGQESESGPEAATGLAAPSDVGATDWADEAARPAALSRLLAAADTSARGATAAPSADGLDRLRDPASLAGCLAALPSGDDDVLAVDYASYAGEPAVAVVQPAQPGSVRVTVVGSGCSAADPDLRTAVLLPRP